MLSLSLLSLSQQMTSDDQRFFKALGARIAAARKAQGLSQQALAEQLGTAQQTLAHYEVGRARPAISVLVQIAHALGVGIEELLGEPVRATGRRGPPPKLQQQMERIARLPRAKQQIVIQMLDGVLAQASR